MLVAMEPDTSSDQRPVIQASEILAKIKRGEPVKYDGVIVVGDLDLSGLDLPKEHVDRTTVEKRLTLHYELEISSLIEITNSVVSGKLKFANAHFQKPINLSGTKFTGRYAHFRGVEFDSDADFREVKFTCQYAYFGGTKFGGNVNFWGAEFGRYAYFRKATFSGDADFGRAKFNGDADFDYRQFHRDVSFKDTKFDYPWSQEMTCRIAKRKMEDLGNKEDADYYFYREMEAVRIQNGIQGTRRLAWPWKMQVSEWFKLIGSKMWRLGWYDIFEHILIQCIFGYGVHPLRLLGFWILMAFAFASFYWYYDAVEGARTSVDYIWFSIATSATPGYALYNPIGNYKIVTGIQAIIGTFMWAAFIATFARKWQR